MRYWLLTNTTYGTWLPGDERGSITSVRDLREGDGAHSFRFEHDLPGELWEEAIPGLQRSALNLMKGPPIFLDLDQANLLLAQFLETAAYRNWKMHALAIMVNHFHLVVEVEDDPNPGKILADFKAYGTRALNRRDGKPPSETWWTTNGSKRKLSGEQALANGIHYVLYKQPKPLLVWSLEKGRILKMYNPQIGASRERQRPEQTTKTLGESCVTPVADATGSPLILVTIWFHLHLGVPWRRPGRTHSRVGAAIPERRRAGSVSDRSVGEPFGLLSLWCNSGGRAAQRLRKPCIS